MNTINTKNKWLTSRILKLALAFCILDLGHAISQTMLGPMLPQIQQQFAISLSKNGLLTFFQGIGGVLALVINIFIADRFNKRTFMVVSYAFYNIMLYLAALMPAYWVILVIFFFIGVGTRLFDTMGNVNMSEVHSEKNGFFLSLLHAFFGIGALLGPILASVLSTRYDLSMSLLLIACLCSVLLVVYFILIGKKEKDNSIETNTAPAAVGFNIFSCLKNRSIIALGLCAMFYVGFSIGVSMWLPSYFMNTMHMSNIFAASIVSVLWVGIIIGRFTYSFLSLKFPIWKLIFISNLVGGLVLLITSIVNTALFLAMGYAIAGFFIGAVVPLSVALANNIYPQYSGRITSIIMLFAAIGFLAIPALIGLVADYIGFYAAIFTLNISPIAIALSSFSLRKTG